MIINKEKDLGELYRSNRTLTVTLEVPAGEIATGGFLKGFLAATIFNAKDPLPITAQDRFNAQGLEGKLSAEVPIALAVKWVEDFGTPGRWQVKVKGSKKRAKK